MKIDKKILERSIINHNFCFYNIKKEIHTNHAKGLHNHITKFSNQIRSIHLYNSRSHSIWLLQYRFLNGLYNNALITNQINKSFINLANAILSYCHYIHASSRSYFRYIYCYIGSFLIKFMDKMGENKIMVLTDILTIITSLIMISSLEIVPLCFSRFLIGIVCGFSVNIIPRYLISISPLEWGGLMGSLHQILITIGIAFAFLLGQKVKNINIFNIQDWQAYLIVPIFYSLVRLIVLNIFK